MSNNSGTHLWVVLQIVVLATLAGAGVLIAQGIENPQAMYRYGEVALSGVALLGAAVLAVRAIVHKWPWRVNFTVAVCGAACGVFVGALRNWGQVEVLRAGVWWGAWAFLAAVVIVGIVLLVTSPESPKQQST